MIESRSPQSPSDVVVTVDEADTEQVGAMVGRARAAAGRWLSMSGTERSAALHACAGALEAGETELTDLIVREVGKPVGEARGEVVRAVSIWRYYAQACLDPDGATYPSPAGGLLLSHRRRPHGVVGLITPWNFPIAIPSWKAAPALAYGNAVVLKPAPEAAAVGMRLVELCRDLLPAGLFEVVTGDATTGSALVGTVDAVSFTGSEIAGGHVALAATARGVPVQAEMGGQNASIVLPDTDMSATAASIARAAMGFAGQKCTATSRVVIVGDPDGFTEALVAAVRGLPVGDPTEPATVVGPVISPATVEAVVAAANSARARGGRILTGGRATEPGWSVQPTLIDRVDPDDVLAQEEVFGPIAVVLGAADLDEAVRITNAVRYGLVTSLYTTDVELALSVSGRLESGMVKINAPSTGVDFWAPFGGDKASSLGPREQGKAAAEFYTRTQTLTVGSTRGMM